MAQWQSIDNLVATQRSRYLRNEISFRQYYLWLADQMHLTRERVTSPIPNSRIIDSTDANFNDIPLGLWDAADWTMRHTARRAGISTWSLSDTVCVQKAIAGEIRDKANASK